jgi:5-methylcytosine-specific restriction endonuclease McrA
MQKQREHGGAESWDRSPRSCVQCGTVFTPQAIRHVYCSIGCRRKLGDRERGFNQRQYRTLFVEERGGCCERCGTTDGLGVHHKTPIAAGGSHRASNVALLCLPCHRIEDKAAFQNANTPTPESERSPELQDNPHVPPAMRAKAERQLSKPPLQRPIVQKKG